VDQIEKSGRTIIGTRCVIYLSRNNVCPWQKVQSTETNVCILSFLVAVRVVAVPPLYNFIWVIYFVSFTILTLYSVDNPESGPSFGADSLVIPFSKDNPRLARSKLGSYYERMPDGGNSLFGNEAAVQLKSLRVYHGVYGPEEYVPFTDAEPFALY